MRWQLIPSHERRVTRLRQFSEGPESVRLLRKLSCHSLLCIQRDLYCYSINPNDRFGLYLPCNLQGSQHFHAGIVGELEAVVATQD